MTVLFVDGFEYQKYSTSTPTSATPLYDDVQASPSYPTVETTIVKHGAASMKCSSSSANSYVRTNTSPTITQTAISFYIRFGVLPANGNRILSLVGGSYQLWLKYGTASGKLYLQWGSSSNTYDIGPVISTGTWYLVDIGAWREGAGWWYAKGQVDGANENTTDGGNNTSFESGVIWGFSDSNSNTFYIDDAIWTDSYADYPIGEHEVKLLVPTGDGTHSNSNGSIEDKNGNDINGTTYTAYTLLDEIPASGTTDYVRQSAAQTGEYAEVTFTDTSDTIILGVQASAGVMSAGTNANTGIVRVVDSGGTTLVDVWSGVMNYTTERYVRKMVPDPGANGWSQSDLNGVKARVGLSSDVDSQPYWTSFALQYAMKESGGGAGDVIDPFGMMGFYGV